MCVTWLWWINWHVVVVPTNPSYRQSLFLRNPQRHHSFLGKKSPGAKEQGEASFPSSLEGQREPKRPQGQDGEKPLTSKQPQPPLLSPSSSTHQTIDITREPTGGIDTDKQTTFEKEDNKNAMQPTTNTTTSATSTNDNDAYVFHIVFSSGCNALQDWQSYAFLYQVWKSGFTGNVTRVASCESKEAAQTLQRHFETHIQQHMSNRFQLHITPDYSHLASDRHAYNFFNKPHGIHHWMTEGLHFPQQASQYQRTIIVLMDPDQFLLRPFEQDMTHGRELWTSESTGYRTIQKGQPMAALYGFGGSFVDRLNVTELLTVPGIRERSSTSGLRTVTASLLARHYAVGPPYVVQAYDMYEIVTAWSQLVVPIYHQEMRGQSPSNNDAAFLAEMHAYSMAAAHLNLPHQVSKSFMISDPESGSEEAWTEWIDKTPRDDKGDKDKNESNDETNICSLNYRYMPHVYHYCQRVYIGPYFFSKYQVPKSPPDDDILACSHPLYQEAPANVMDLYNSSITLDGQWHNLSQRQRRRMAFGVCQILPRLNAAVAFYKQHHCSPASAANYSKVFIHETHEAKAKRLRLLKQEKEQAQRPR